MVPPSPVGEQVCPPTMTLLRAAREPPMTPTPLERAEDITGRYSCFPPAVAIRRNGWAVLAVWRSLAHRRDSGKPACGDDNSGGSRWSTSQGAPTRGVLRHRAVRSRQRQRVASPWYTPHIDTEHMSSICIANHPVKINQRPDGVVKYHHRVDQKAAAPCLYGHQRLLRPTDTACCGFM